jgi:hypothetical protein
MLSKFIMKSRNKSTYIPSLCCEFALVWIEETRCCAHKRNMGMTADCDMGLNYSVDLVIEVSHTQLTAYIAFNQ